MSTQNHSHNGEAIIKIGDHGKRKFQFGDDGLILEIDVVAAHNAWVEIDQQFRGEDGKIPPQNITPCNHAVWDFVKGLIMAGAPGDRQSEAQELCQRISLTSALEFLARLTEETLKLRSFFEVRSSEKPSSPESTKVRFST